jgi:ABC-type sugar transport system permease subunit
VGVGPVDWLGYHRSGVWLKPAIALVTIWQYVGWNVLLFAAGLHAIPSEMLEAGRIDGANDWAIATIPMVVITLIGARRLIDGLTAGALSGQ